jgi:hypothetical protein
MISASCTETLLKNISSKAKSILSIKVTLITSYFLDNYLKVKDEHVTYNENSLPRYVWILNNMKSMQNRLEPLHYAKRYILQVHNKGEIYLNFTF